MQRIRHAVGAIIQQGQEYLLVHKVKGMDTLGGPRSIPGMWDFPKGGMKAGETTIEAVLREVREETGGERYRIVKQFDETIDFAFDEQTRQSIGYDRQETTMFLLAYLGDRLELGPLDEEIDQVHFFSALEVCQHLAHRETKDYFLRVVLQNIE
ncbi:MAG TPA: NUDIX hydrolase [Ktedonosporobacter sp.]|nr:NUDIX hydrolase [Ktedonosporobacter sp.]